MMTYNMDREERAKMVLAMEYIVRRCNNEEILDTWLTLGVPDGDIPYGCFDTSKVEDYHIQDDNFTDYMTTFLKCMVQAWNDGGLYCDEIVSNDKND